MPINIQTEMIEIIGWNSGPWFNIKMTSYQDRKFHCGNKTILRQSYLHNGISHTGKTTSLYLIGALVAGFLIARGIELLECHKVTFQKSCAVFVRP